MKTHPATKGILLFGSVCVFLNGAAIYYKAGLRGTIACVKLARKEKVQAFICNGKGTQSGTRLT